MFADALIISLNCRPLGGLSTHPSKGVARRSTFPARLLLNGIHYAHLFMQPTVNCDEAWQALAQKTIDTSSTEPETKGNNNHQDGKPETATVRGREGEVGSVAIATAS